MLMPLLKRIKNRLDYSEYGGAPLLGVDGIVIVGHGRSNAYAVRSAINVARVAVQEKMVEAIRAELADQISEAELAGAADV